MTHQFANIIPVAPQMSRINPACRGRYQEIRRIGQKSAEKIIDRFRSCLPEEFAQLDRKQRGDALNLDLYGYCRKQGVAVVQIRHFFKRAARHFGTVHKDYVLVGFNELTKEPFRHPISAHAVRAGVRKSPDDPTIAVRAAQAWMWDVKVDRLPKCMRQGDVLIVPERSAPKGERLGESSHVIGGSHRIDSVEIVVDSELKVYARQPTLTHLKAQHHPLQAPTSGWYSVRLAREVATWDWSERLGD